MNGTNQHVERLFEKFQEGQYADMYYAFNASNYRFEYLNVNVRHYVPASERTYSSHVYMYITCFLGIQFCE